jgi:hypothetical protein
MSWKYVIMGKLTYMPEQRSQINTNPINVHYTGGNESTRHAKAVNAK